MAYNPSVPTPFYHLSLAEALLTGEVLDREERDFLRQQRGEFLLGNVAPDVQVVSGQPRLVTHFFDLPVQRNRLPAWTQFFAAYPRLTRPDALPPGQAAFLAGYICHLLADWFWASDIFSPIFGLSSNWESFPHRLYLHNVLRAYLDRNILPALPGYIASDLQDATPRGWLPFVQDQYLLAWRDDLAGQLQPGERTRTVEVFAERQGLSPQEYYALLDSNERMEREIFSHLPRQNLEAYRQRAEMESARLVRAYLRNAINGGLRVPAPPSNLAEG